MHLTKTILSFSLPLQLALILLQLQIFLHLPLVAQWVPHLLNSVPMSLSLMILCWKMSLKLFPSLYPLLIQMSHSEQVETLLPFPSKMMKVSHYPASACEMKLVLSIRRASCICMSS